METPILHGTEAWRQLRFDCVTGTDVASILGLNDTSRMRLLTLKAKREEEEPNQYGKDLMALGNTFEPVARAQYLAWSGKAQQPTPPLFRHENITWLVGSPDLLDYDDKIVVEFKTRFYPSPAEASPFRTIESIPLKYYLQVQTYMEIMDWDRGHLFVWSPRNGWSLFEFRRDRNLFEAIRMELERFHEVLLRLKRVGADSTEGKELIGKARMKPGEKEQWVMAVWNSMKENTVHLK